MKMFRAAILTAKEVEFDAVRRHLMDERRVDDTFDGTVYRRAKIRSELGGDVPVEQWDVAIYRTGRGQQPTTYGTQILLQHFRPDIVLYVGVAGGDPSRADLSIGDIVVGKLVRYYERTSQHADHFTIKDEPHSPNRALISAAEYEADETNWLRRVDGSLPNSQVFVEEIASGDKVQKSASSVLWNAIKERYPDVIAVETEGHGFHYAVAQSAGRGLMVRSISDLLDNKDDDASEFGSDDERQALASAHAAAFAINLIVNLNTKFLEDIRESTAFRYAVIIKISADNLEGVHRATRLFADAINDPYLTVESLQPANSFVLRVSTTLYSAAYARAIFRGGFISDLLGTEVSALESDVERTGEVIFDEFLQAVMDGNPERILSAEAKLLDAYPMWRAAALSLERLVLTRRERSVDRLDELRERRVRDQILAIREIADRRNIKSSALAEMAGVSQRTMRQILKLELKPSLSLVTRLEVLLEKLREGETSIGDNIRQLRVDLRISQAELANRIGLPPSTLSVIERGIRRPSPDIERKLQQVLQEYGFKVRQ